MTGESGDVVVGKKEKGNKNIKKKDERTKF